MFVAHMSRTMANAKPKYRSEENWKQRIADLEQQIKHMEEVHLAELTKMRGEIVRMKERLDDKIQLLSKHKIREFSYAEIERRICRATGVSKQDISRVTRKDEIVRARMAVAYWSKRLTGLSFPQIGRKMNRDHTTVIHAVREYPKKRAKEGRTLRKVA